MTRAYKLIKNFLHIKAFHRLLANFYCLPHNSFIDTFLQQCDSTAVLMTSRATKPEQLQLPVTLIVSIFDDLF